MLYMVTIARAWKIGRSVVITINPKLLKEHNVKAGDFIKINIEKVKL